MVSILLKGGLLLLFLITSLQLVKRDEWWVRFSDFPHVQLTILATLLYTGHLVTATYTDWIDLIFLLLGFALILYQFIIIFPYTPLAVKQSKSWSHNGTCQSLSILESNVFMKNQEYHLLVDLINQYDPDIVIALEPNQKWQEGISEIESKYSYAIQLPLENTYGILFYSKLEIIKFNINHLIEEDIPSLEIDLLMMSGHTVRMYIVHPEPPSPTEKYQSTERDTELIIIGKKVKNCEYPVIVAGDLNDVAWSHTTRLFQRLSGLLDPRIGRGFYNTFHARYPILRWPLDHIFHSKHFLVKQIKRLPSVGSDHFPMLLELSLEPIKGEKKNEAPDSFNETDRLESIDKINKIRSKNNN